MARAEIAPGPEFLEAYIGAIQLARCSWKSIGVKTALIRPLC